jgi:hypothetical protein
MRTQCLLQGDEGNHPAPSSCAETERGIGLALARWWLHAAAAASNHPAPGTWSRAAMLSVQMWLPRPSQPLICIHALPGSMTGLHERNAPLMHGWHAVHYSSPWSLKNPRLLSNYFQVKNSTGQKEHKTRKQNKREAIQIPHCSTPVASSNRGRG